MIIYKDILTSDEMISDAYKLEEVDDTLYEANCQMITVKKGADVDIGANPSAEDGDNDGAEDGSETVNNIAYSFRLQSTSFDKKSYLTYLRGYMKGVKNVLQQQGKAKEEIDSFEKRAQVAAKKIVANFGDYEFYTGESMNPEGMVVLLNYRVDGITPYMTFWKDGLAEMKV